MDFVTFRRILDQVPTLKTLLPYQWGEPLLNPEVFDCISYAASRGIRIMLTTNGTLLTEEACKRLIQAGLSRLSISFDGNRETHASLRGVDPDRVLANAVRFRALRDRLGSPCSLDATMVVDEYTEPFMSDFQDLFRSVADRVQYIPRFVRAPRIAPCRELWRGVLVVLANGDATLCCVDVHGEAVYGNVEESSPRALFNSPAMGRTRSMHRQRDFPNLCRWCSEYSSSCVSPRFS